MCLISSAQAAFASLVSSLPDALCRALFRFSRERRLVLERRAFKAGLKSDIRMAGLKRHLDAARASRPPELRGRGGRYAGGRYAGGRYAGRHSRVCHARGACSARDFAPLAALALSVAQGIRVPAE